MRQIVDAPRFGFLELILVTLCGAVWMIKPAWGIWFIPTALLPMALRVFAGRFRFKGIDWLVAVFVVTAWVGYWAAYDQAMAWNKAWMVVIAAMLYFSLKAQPERNLFHISAFLFFLGVGVSVYYFLTHDFVALPRKLEFVNGLGRWIMTVRPQTSWRPIHPNYVAGMIAVTAPFILYPMQDYRKGSAKTPVLFSLAVIVGSMLAGLALIMATSRGAVFAIASGAGGWLLWRSLQWAGTRRRIKSEAAFPILLLIYLCASVAFLYFGPARSGSLFTGNYYYGDGSRAELFSRSIHLLLDYPITGGGLGAFPGLYSQYLLGIPFFNVPNSHNLFLDVGIEQGLIGGLSFLLLYLASVWTVSGAIADRRENQTFRWIVLFSLIVAIVHGMVDDYLYNGVGAMLSLFLAGLCMNGRKTTDETRTNPIDLRTAGAIAAIWLAIAFVNLNQIRAVWYANLGALQLAKVELDGFPDAGWAGEDIVPLLDEADASLHSALQFDPTNRTANQRLGLIHMYRRDFDTASRYLEIAHARAPEHRGIIKSLAYCYVWLGNADKAREFLVQIPEAIEELDVYTRWWDAQGRNDLSTKAQLALEFMNATVPQP